MMDDNGIHRFNCESSPTKPNWYTGMSVIPVSDNAEKEKPQTKNSLFINKRAEKEKRETPMSLICEKERQER
jgi:hypothetical protein